MQEQEKVNSKGKKRFSGKGNLKIIVPPPNVDDPLDERAQAQAQGITCETQK